MIICKCHKLSQSYGYHLRQRKGDGCSCAESCVQIYARFKCDFSTVGTHKNKKELKKIPVFKEIKKLSTEAVSALSHAVSASYQQRKDAIKSESDSKFHSLCELAQPVPATQVFGDNLNAELKKLNDSKKVAIAKKMFFSSLKERTDMIRNILHRLIVVKDSQKITNLFKEKG